MYARLTTRNDQGLRGVSATTLGQDEMVIDGGGGGVVLDPSLTAAGNIDFYDGGAMISPQDAIWSSQFQLPSDLPLAPSTDFTSLDQAPVPLDPNTGLPFPIDPMTLNPIDPMTGLPPDLPLAPSQDFTPLVQPPIQMDPATGFPIDPTTGLPTDPSTGLPVNLPLTPPPGTKSLQTPLPPVNVPNVPRPSAFAPASGASSGAGGGSSSKPSSQQQQQKPQQKKSLAQALNPTAPGVTSSWLQKASLIDGIPNWGVLLFGGGLLYAFANSGRRR